MLHISPVGQDNARLGKWHKTIEYISVPGLRKKPSNRFSHMYDGTSESRPLIGMLALEVMGSTRNQKGDFLPAAFKSYHQLPMAEVKKRRYAKHEVGWNLIHLNEGGYNL
ncbi:hypothetical protein J2TS6_36520 [Paenibacillus albilobatus]|uniref:Uncharacterized protein n=1 Tax=Paenibacillus albilobatus TaxID=2716884 RepID=A0A919XGP8_9BACL|nr:hypothetical protein J2TS6_36520 [Paenibacillus albilobatus]